MTALTIASQIPTNIALIEQHLAWAGMSLAYLNPTVAVLESPTVAEKVAQTAIFQAADNTYRLLVRATLPLDVNFMSDKSKKLWMFVNEVSNVTIPANFTTN